LNLSACTTFSIGTSSSRSGVFKSPITTCTNSGVVKSSIVFLLPSPSATSFPSLSARTRCGSALAIT
jgi:hypothetical protein